MQSRNTRLVVRRTKRHDGVAPAISTPESEKTPVWPGIPPIRGQYIEEDNRGREYGQLSFDAYGKCTTAIEPRRRLDVIPTMIGRAAWVILVLST